MLPGPALLLPGWGGAAGPLAPMRTGPSLSASASGAMPPTGSFQVRGVCRTKRAAPWARTFLLLLANSGESRKWCGGWDFL